MNFGICCGLSRFHLWLYVSAAGSSCMGNPKRCLWFGIKWKSSEFNSLHSVISLTRGASCTWHHPTCARGWVLGCSLQTIFNFKLTPNITALPSHDLNTHDWPLWTLALMERVTEVVKVKYLNVVLLVVLVFTIVLGNALLKWKISLIKLTLCWNYTFWLFLETLYKVAPWTAP